MSGTHISNYKLDNKSNLNKLFLKTNAQHFGLNSIALLCLLGINACTSSNSSPSLISKPTLEETLSSASKAELEILSQEQSTLAAQGEPTNKQINVPVPSRSPAYQSSLIAETVSPVKATIKETSIEASKTNTTTFVPSVSPKQPQNASNAIGNTNSDTKLTANQVAKANNAQITATSSDISDKALQTASISREAPVKKLNFFQRLLKSRRDKIAADKRATQKSALDAEVLKLAKANKTGANGNTDQASIKTGTKLLSIEEANEHDDESNVEVASVGALGRTAGPHGLILQTQGVQVACLRPGLLAVLKKVERRFGKKVMVTSGYRSPARNRRAGGVKNSHHTTCNAADIQLAGISKWDVAKYLRTIEGRGGVGTYCRTKSVHIDIGSQRDWHQPCRRRKRRK